MYVSFQLKKTKIDQQGKVPIYVRITINSLRTEFSIQQNVYPDKWLSNAGIVKGSNEESKSLNAFMATVRLKLNEKYRLLMETNKLITPETIKNAYLGISEKGKTILEVFNYHNTQLKALVNSQFALGTYDRYCTALKHVKEFLQFKYKISDISIKQINHEFITEFEYYLKTERKCCHNTTMKYITNFKKIIGICIKNKWIIENPFENYKINLKEVEREYLSKDEIQAITDKEFATQRLAQIRDIFLFCCFTGLSYADVKKLSKEHIITGIDGEHWIKINRTKTDVRSSIPLLPMASDILNKYKDDVKCQANKKLLPVLSNQKMNDYLKEIAAVCGINKNITFHLARHTFATTITLANGVALESVGKMLGHRSIKTTQHYAKVIDRKLSEDMKLVRQKLSFLSNTKQQRLMKIS